jgi:hypothetical protein
MFSVPSTLASETGIFLTQRSVEKGMEPDWDLNPAPSEDISRNPSFFSLLPEYLRAHVVCVLLHEMQVLIDRVSECQPSCLQKVKSHHRGPFNLVLILKCNQAKEIGRIRDRTVCENVHDAKKRIQN